MTRNAFTMQLLPGVVDEYKRRHDEIWPDLKALLSEAGISDYSIFLDENSLKLFACYTPSENNTIASLPNHPLMKKWWDYMAPLMETEPSNKPVQTDLSLMFHMD